MEEMEFTSDLTRLPMAAQYLWKKEGPRPDRSNYPDASNYVTALASYVRRFHGYKYKVQT